MDMISGSVREPDSLVVRIISVFFERFFQHIRHIQRKHIKMIRRIQHAITFGDLQVEEILQEPGRRDEKLTFAAESQEWRSI